MLNMDSAVREEVHQLAEVAFHLKLISGYGDGEYIDKYQIVYQGKPKHFPLEKARQLLTDLIENHSSDLLEVGDNSIQS
jgi:hypothetical protein